METGIGELLLIFERLVINALKASHTWSPCTQASVLPDGVADK